MLRWCKRLPPIVNGEFAALDSSPVRLFFHPEHGCFLKAQREDPPAVLQRVH